MDTTEIKADAVAGAGYVKRAAQSAWQCARSFVAASPRIVSAILLVAVPAALYFGLVQVRVTDDPTMQTQIDGAGLAISEIKSDISLLAPKSDVAALAARLDKLERAALQPLTTGSITVKGKR